MHRRQAQPVYDAAVLKYKNRICKSLSIAMHPYKRWSTLKTFLFGVNFSLPPIRTDNTYNSSEMAEVFFYNFSE